MKRVGPWEPIGGSCSRLTTAWVIAEIAGRQQHQHAVVRLLKGRHFAKRVDLIDTGVGPRIGQHHEPGVDQQADAVSHGAKFYLRRRDDAAALLLLLGRFGHQHIGFHFLAAAALAHAAHRRRIQVVAAHREAAISAHGGALVGHVHALPTDFRA